MGDERLTAMGFQQAGGVEDWRVLGFGASAWFVAPSQAAGAELVRRLAELAGDTGRLPDGDVRPGGVGVRIGTPGSALTPADVEAARAVSAAAADLGLAADPAAVQSVRLAIDAMDKPTVMRCWQAVLGYERLGEDDLVDAMRRNPAVWFQQQDEPRPLRNRIHVDVSGPQVSALQGVDAAAAVGGRYVRRGYPTLADDEGNEVDVVPVDRWDEDTGAGDWQVMFGAMLCYPVAPPVRAAEFATVVAGLPTTRACLY